MEIAEEEYGMRVEAIRSLVETVVLSFLLTKSVMVRKMRDNSLRLSRGSRSGGTTQRGCIQFISLIH